MGKSKKANDTLPKLSLEKIADGIKSNEYKNIAFMVGAGISTNAGMPDFRSPETGLYANLERLNLPYPEAVFDISYFKRRPEAFFTLADELFPGKYPPTKFHRFMKLVQDKGLLKRVYTQNIDMLERLAGVDDDKIVEAHGSFANSACVECGAAMSLDKVKQVLWEDKNKLGIPRCKSESCTKAKGGLVKPSIVFFGESLPEKFFDSMEADLPDEIDLAIVAGTSLTVYPFAQVPQSVSRTCPRLLFNDSKVGDLGSRPKDVLSLGDCDKKIQELCDLLGWTLPDNDSSVEKSTDQEEATENVKELAEKLAEVELDGKE